MEISILWVYYGGLGFGWGASYGWGMGGFYDPFWGYPYYAYRPHYWEVTTARGLVAAIMRLDIETEMLII